MLELLERIQKRIAEVPQMLRDFDAWFRQNEALVFCWYCVIAIFLMIYAYARVKS